MTTTEIRDFLTTLMRGIDKKTILTVQPLEKTDRAGVMVHLSRDKRSAALEISEDDLEASQRDLMRRNQVRTALKRARDRMWAEITPIFSTKTEHHKMEGIQPFRQTQGGGRGRR